MSQSTSLPTARLHVILTKYGKDNHQKQQEEYHVQYGDEYLEYLLHHPEIYQAGVKNKCVQRFTYISTFFPCNILCKALDTQIASANLKCTQNKTQKHIVL